MNKPCAATLLLFLLSFAAGAATLNLAAVEHDRILKAADVALKQEPITITAFPAKLSDGGLHDFYSNGDYWWPNPDTTNGLPYIRRDGESNPENFVAHRRCVVQLREAVAALAAAYKITGDDKYVAKAASLLKVFFLDDAMRMNPNLQFAQAIPGVSRGRGIGIIDTLQLVEVPLAIETMQKSPALPADELAGLKKWFADYVQWMTTSKNGLEEANAGNNHAVAFWLQVAAFAQFTGDEKNLAECRRRYKEVFIPKQMAADGSFPAELARTKPYGYSIFQLDNLTLLCQLLSTSADNLWNFELPDGRGIRKGIAFLYPYLAEKSKWPRKPDVQSWDGWPVRCPALIFGGLALGEQKYLDLWCKLPAEMPNDEIQRNIAISEPILWLKNDSQPSCMAVLGKFTAPQVPALGSAETEVAPGSWVTNSTPENLPGNGLAQHPMLYLGEGYNKLFVVNDGKIIWTYQTGKGWEYDDAWMLSNGNILFTRMQYLAEVTPEKKVIWRYDCPTNTEVHCCQPIGLDKVLFIQNGLPPKLKVINIKTGAVEVNHDLPAKSLTDSKTVHPQFRRVRFTAQGTYLVPMLGLGTNGAVVEYDKNFKEVWRYPIRSPWAAIRLKNGNTLITDESDKLTREVNPKGETVWELRPEDLPPPYRFLNTQTCTRLANGNTIVCSRGGNGKGPQLVEVTPDKKVVWVLQDWTDLGPATAVQILDDPGVPENPGESEH